MFINDNHLVALEYVFYNNDGKYYHLETTDKGNSELGVQDYEKGAMQDHKYKFEHLNAYQNEPKSYEANMNKDYLDNKCFINSGARNTSEDSQHDEHLIQDSPVEAIISLWKIDFQGAISKEIE